MKTALIFVAVIALAWTAAVPKEDKKDVKTTEKPIEKTTERPAERSTDKPAEKPAEKPTEKPAEKPEDKPEDGRLQWPLPEPRNEGDLMFHGSHLYDRVEELHKGKVESDVDKMILAVGRDFLRKAHQYLEATPDFKIVPVLCRDSRELSKSSRRWEIRLQAENQPAEEKKAEKKEEQAKPQNDATVPKTKRDVLPPPKEEVKVNSTESVNATESFNVTEPAKPEAKPEVQAEAPENYEARRGDFYRRMGDNFARLLLKNYRKEKMSDEEREYIENWSEEEAIHYGVLGIYCHEGENAKDLIKKIKEIAEEK